MWYPVELVLSPKVPPLETSWKTSLLSGPGSLKKSVYSSPLPLGSLAVLGALTPVWWVQLLFINLASELLQREHEGHQLSLGWDEEGEVTGKSRCCLGQSGRRKLSKCEEEKKRWAKQPRFSFYGDLSPFVRASQAHWLAKGLKRKQAPAL